MIRAGEILHYSDIVLTINNLHYVRLKITQEKVTAAFSEANDCPKAIRF